MCILDRYCGLLQESFAITISTRQINDREGVGVAATMKCACLETWKDEWEQGAGFESNVSKTDYLLGFVVIITRILISTSYRLQGFLKEIPRRR